MRFTKPSKVIGLDIGSHSVKAVQLSKAGGGKLRIEEVGYALVDRNQVNMDPIAAHANASREALRMMTPSQSLVVGALPGQTVVIRYPRLREMALDQIDAAIETEAGQSIPYDLSEVFLDWSLLGTEGEGDEKQLKVLLVAAKHEVIDSRVQIADAAEVEYGALSVDNLALADAAEGCDFLRVGESVALINIGASSASIHFIKDGVSNFIRDVTWGAREMIQAIVKARRCDYDEAERILYNAEAEFGAEEQDDEAPIEAEEVVPEVRPEADDVDALDKGSLLDPLDDELGAFGEEEPASDVGGFSDMGGDEDTPLSEILIVPVSRLVSEIRRSFDYYEHQLYERPVERIILSGGVAHIAAIREALIEDLGVEEVAVADPTASALVTTGRYAEEFNQHPAQFMVAVGLAARGSVEL